ncbi:hypothetical protein O0I10_004160 [Lichtheimia ornata]|uniref:Polysaccharide lyase 14 domain-containing protein n=1 Tax=Lichtheimia ornata TaxID=688661 RepID=A0AAD7V5V2_9FUNG|nr:uncharacterized protein O0I10_004160 [Lichtheimia ornata]KAJ8659934.1 hypothetical protein O0I10_004160 [Lichtheimia ornata]
MVVGCGALVTAQQSWTAPMNGPKGGNAAHYLAKNWHVPNANFYGHQDVSFTNDPISGDNNTSVLQVKYKEGAYGAMGVGGTSGCEFNVYPFGRSASYESAMVSYQVAFAEGFEWVEGGKLPGIFGGDAAARCSGGNLADGTNCFSMRLMWRSNGNGEAYAYIPENGLCDSGKKNVTCEGGYGVSISRGAIKFKTNTWTKLSVYVKMNDANASNGELKVWQDGALVINASNIKYRTSNKIGATSLMFSTFFGGAGLAYASAVDTSAYFKDIEMSVG